MRNIPLALASLVCLVIFVIPHFVLAHAEHLDDTQVLLAQSGDDNPVGGRDDNPRPSSSGSVSLLNPLQADNIQEFFLAILDILLVFAIPIIVLFIMYAGFLYVTAQGEEGKIEKAHAALTWSVIGGVIILGAKLIIEVIQNTVNAI